jgi:hypothetical protein
MFLPQGGKANMSYEDKADIPWTYQNNKITLNFYSVIFSFSNKNSIPIREFEFVHHRCVYQLDLLYYSIIYYI